MKSERGMRKTEKWCARWGNEELLHEHILQCAADSIKYERTKAWTPSVRAEMGGSGGLREGILVGGDVEIIYIW